LRPAILTIAGSDSSGGAGIQADIRAIEAAGGYAATAITAITAQNTRGVRRVEVLPAGLLRAQIEAVLDDLPVAAVKSGMLGGADAAETLAAILAARRDLPYVCDPVIAASDGTPLLDGAGLAVLRERVIPLASVLTPNVPEARALTGRPIANVEQAVVAARALLELGAQAVVIKGGHLDGATATDVLVCREGHRLFAAPRFEAPHGHGGGCVFSAALATWLGAGCPLERAVERAKAMVAAALRHGLALGQGRGPVDPRAAPRLGSVR